MNKNIEVVRCLPGFDLELDPQDDTVSAWIGKNKWWEKTNANALSSFLLPDSVVVDAGAHIGYYTCLFASIVKDGFVYAFEPNPRTFEFLLRNVERNKFRNVLCTQKALGEEEKEVFFHAVTRGNTGDSNVSRKEEICRVQMVRLDKFLDSQPEKRRKVTIMKSDTQGYEWDIFQGLGEYVHGLDAGLVEWSPESLQKTTPSGFLSFLSSSFNLQYSCDESPFVSLGLGEFPPRNNGDILFVKKI